MINNQFLRAYFDSIFYKIDLKARAEHANNRIVPHKLIVKLSKSEITIAKHFWGKDWSKSKRDSLAFYKQHSGYFDVKFIPNDYYDFAEHVLNLRWASFFLQHKCCLNTIIPDIYRPKTIIKKINGHIVDDNYNEINEDYAVNLLLEKKEFVQKIARGTGGGRGVKRINIKAYNTNNIKNLLSPDDVLFQEVLVQNSFMARLNPDSVNTIRMLTLNINHYCTLLSSFVRIGNKGSFVDNVASGGGIFCGVDQNGKLSPYGLTKFFEKKYYTPSGVLIKGLEIPNFAQIKQQIIDFHRKIPFVNLIAWDVAINEEGQPIVIEINLDSGEVECHQIFNGPVFGNRTMEVLKFINKKIPTLKHAMITY